MKFLFALIILIIVLAIIIVIASQSNYSSSRGAGFSDVISGLSHFINSQIAKKEDNVTRNKPGAIVITRITTDTLDLKKVIGNSSIENETIIATIDDFPMKVGRINRSKLMSSDPVMALPECSNKDGVSKEHIWIKQLYDTNTKKPYYSIENIGHDNEIAFYCNDDNVPENKKYGILYNNVGDSKENPNRQCLVFFNSITLVLGQVVIRLYRNQYFHEQYNVSQFKKYVAQQNASQTPNDSKNKVNSTPFVVPTPPINLNNPHLVVDEESTNGAEDEPKIIISNSSKGIKLD